MNEADAAVLEQGDRAQAALDFLTPVFAAMQAKTLELIDHSAPQHHELRERLFLHRRAIKHAESTLVTMVEAAAVSQRMLDHDDLMLEAQNAMAADGLTRP